LWVTKINNITITNICNFSIFKSLISTLNGCWIYGELLLKLTVSPSLTIFSFVWHEREISPKSGLKLSF
jgi:hypothetical protein